MHLAARPAQQIALSVPFVHALRVKADPVIPSQHKPERFVHDEHLVTQRSELGGEVCEVFNRA